jgi:hypothetical protein
MDTDLENTATLLIYELWYSIAETIFEKVCKVTELDEEQIAALRAIALKPNDFHVAVE